MSDEVTVVIIEKKPKPERQSRTQTLPFTSMDARDVCGDGTNEFRHINPLVIWKNLPALYFIEDSVPENLVQGVVDSFKVWNDTAGKQIYARTSDQSQAKINVNIEPIDSQGGTLARASWSYSQSRGEMTRATITFDSRERWAILTEESCGSNGGTFDIINVGVHEVGHISGLSHAPTDRLQTMFASTGPGVTLGRTLGNGDILGFSQAYDFDEPPPPPPPECPPGQHLENGVCVPDTPPPPPPPPPPPVSTTKPKIITTSGVTYLNVAYENVSGKFLNIKNLPFNGPHAKIITESGKQYVYLYYYRAANVFTTLGRIPLQ